jgi:hypothetical protein
MSESNVIPFPETFRERIARKVSAIADRPADAVVPCREWSRDTWLSSAPLLRPLFGGVPNLRHVGGEKS